MGSCCGKPKQESPNKKNGSQYKTSGPGKGKGKGGEAGGSHRDPGGRGGAPPVGTSKMASHSESSEAEMPPPMLEIADVNVGGVDEYGADNGDLITDPKGVQHVTQQMNGVLYFFDDEAQDWLVVPESWLKGKSRVVAAAAGESDDDSESESDIEFATFKFYDNGKELTTISRGGNRLYCDFEKNTWVPFPREWMTKGEFSESPYTRDDLQLLDEDQVETEQTVQLRNQIKQFEKRVKEYAARQKEREKQISKQMAAWKQKVADLERRNKELTSANMTNAKRLEQALANGGGGGDASGVDSEEVERLRQQLEQAKRERESEVAAITERVEAAEARADRLHNEKTELASSFEDRLREAMAESGKVEDSEAKAEELRLKVRALERQLEESRETESELRATIELRERDVERVTKEKDEREEAAFDLQDKLIKAKQVSSQAKASADRQDLIIANLKTALASARSQIAGLHPHLQELRDEVHSQHANLNPLMNEWTSDIMNQIKRELAGVAVYKEKWRKEMQERKKIFNQLQELRGNIRVFCRVRNLIPSEIAKGDTKVAIEFPDEGEVTVISKGMERTFDFDQVFDMKADQAKVFEQVKPLVTSCVDGFHVCIFAYGQTGAGKTYTMMGPADNRGVNYRALEELFGLAKERSQDFTFTIEASFIEIYNEQIRDLLSSVPVTQQKHDIRTSKQEGVHVPGLVKRPVAAIVDVMNVIDEGEAKRTTKATSMNAHSSRSHSLLVIDITGVNESLRFKRSGKLTLVDLAGSERVSKSEASGQRLVEAQNINKSLSALGNVLCSLQTDKSHVPFRDSKITHLLQDSLKGDSKVLMFVNASPKASDSDESICTFKFGERARKVVVGQAKAQTSSVGTPQRGTPQRGTPSRRGRGLPTLG